MSNLQCSRCCTPHLPRFVTITASPQVFDCLKIPALSRFVNLINQFLQPVSPLSLPPCFVPRDAFRIWPLWINAHCCLPNRGSVLRVYFVSDLSAGLTINKQRNGIPLLIAYAGSQTLYRTCPSVRRSFPSQASGVPAINLL
jgi:hypothetical protein